MDTEILKSFVVLAESDSVSQAARKLYIAQSALSNRLKALEKECGATLIERDYHNFKLTACGRQFYERALKIVELTDCAVEEIRSAVTGAGGTLTLAATPSLATGVLRDLIKRYRREYPAVTLRTFEGATPHVLYRLDEGLCDVAFVRSPFTTNPAYSVHTVYRDKMKVLSAEPLPQVMGFEELFKYPLILTHRYASMLERIARRLGTELDSPVQCEEIATCVAFAESGLGLTMVPESGYRIQAEHGSKLYSAALLSDECDTTCDVVVVKNRRLSLAATNFLALINN